MRRFAVVIGCALLSLAAAGCASAGTASGASAPVTTRLTAAHESTATTTWPVVVDCVGDAQSKPGIMILACADAGDVLTGLHWSSWGNQAFGTGTEKINDCTPDCADGKFISYPALVVLWRPEARPGHPGQRYFSRVTRIYTGARPPLYYCQGTKTCYPLTSTFDLWGGTS